jgi:hypothetical protein
MGEPIPVLTVPPGTYLSREQAQRLSCFARVLEMVAGRSVPIQVVQRIAVWIYSGEVEE